MQNFENELNEYINILFKSEEGIPGRQYLKSRQIKVDTAKYWKLGYCPIGYIPKCYRGEENTYPFWEKMWGRLIIPIYDQHGNLVSLSGRMIIKYNDGPKYDHYKFFTRKVLFGLYQNKQSITEMNRCKITEGQMDVISSWQHGLKNVTSSFGAHGSLTHFAIISRYCNKIDVLYDGDTAGKKGMDAIKDFSTYGDLNVNIVNNIFSNGEDLDEWIKKNNPEKLFYKIDKYNENKLKYKLSLMNNKFN